MPSKTLETPTENAPCSAVVRNAVILSRKYEESVECGDEGKENFIKASNIRACVIGHLCRIMASKN